VRKLIAGPTVFICDDCVYLSLSIISRDQINLRVAYFSIQFVAKLLFPLSRLAERLHIVRKPD
jgi:ATP-dependent protease Clp ATPase subunit